MFIFVLLYLSFVYTTPIIIVMEFVVLRHLHDNDDWRHHHCHEGVAKQQTHQPSAEYSANELTISQ